MHLLGPAFVGDELQCIPKLLLRLHLLARIAVFFSFQYLCYTKAKQMPDIRIVFEAVVNTNALIQQLDCCQICVELQANIPL